MSNEYTPSEFELVQTYALHGTDGMAKDREDAQRAIAKIKADAWDEGLQAGWEEHENPGPFVNDYWDSKLPNPYKEGQA